jgi:hypothetical protein
VQQVHGPSEHTQPTVLAKSQDRQFAGYKRFEPTSDSYDTSVIIAGCKASATACIAGRHNRYVQVSTIVRPQPMPTL